jgi:hypothetical protein
VAVLVCVATALLRGRPRWWLGAGVAAGLGLEDNNLMVLLVTGLAAGLLLSRQRPVFRSRWPWLGGGIAAVIWAPNVAWQASHGWPELTMAAALRRLDSSGHAYALGLPDQLAFAGLLSVPLLAAGFVRVWRDPGLRFLAITAMFLIVYVLLWIPGKVYYCQGTFPALLAAGSVTAERWVARARRPELRRGLAVAAPLLSMAVSLPVALPVVPVADLHRVPATDTVTTVDTVGWPQLTGAVATLDAALARAGQRPTSIFTGNYGEAGALDVLGAGRHLPPVLSGHNSFWMWGPGTASDRTVLVVDAFGALRPYFASCRVLTTWNPPFGVRSDYNGLQIGVCTGPAGSWHTLWPRLKHYD